MTSQLFSLYMEIRPTRISHPGFIGHRCAEELKWLIGQSLWQSFIQCNRFSGHATFLCALSACYNTVHFLHYLLLYFGSICCFSQSQDLARYLISAEISASLQVRHLDKFIFEPSRRARQFTRNAKINLPPPTLSTWSIVLNDNNIFCIGYNIAIWKDFIMATIFAQHSMIQTLIASRKP